MRRVVRLLGFVYAIGGASMLEIFAVASKDIQHPAVHVAHLVGALLIGGFLLLAAQWAPDTTIETGYELLAVFVLVGSTVFITTAGWAVGPAIVGVGTGVYLL